jgi:hypothetical protein
MIFPTRRRAPWPCGVLSGFSCVECRFMHHVGIGHGRLPGLGCDAGPRCFRSGQPIKAARAKAAPSLCVSPICQHVGASGCIQFPHLQMQRLGHRGEGNTRLQTNWCAKQCEDWPVMTAAATISRGACGPNGASRVPRARSRLHYPWRERRDAGRQSLATGAQQ